MFRRLDEAGKKVRFTYDDQDIEAIENENLAAALLIAGKTSLRVNPVSKQPRAPYCMMGACFECLVEIDGISRQACMVQVSEGLVVNSILDIGGNEDV
jgi:D-hydroxyproline dehydrogenase subunit gamma